jgi:hypothetical protein
MFKRRLVTVFLNWSGEWNSEIHNIIESKVQDEYRRTFPEGAKDADEMIEQMRDFYYSRITTTANLLIGMSYQLYWLRLFHCLWQRSP